MMASKQVQTLFYAAICVLATMLAMVPDEKLEVSALGQRRQTDSSQSGHDYEVSHAKRNIKSHFATGASEKESYSRRTKGRANPIVHKPRAGKPSLNDVKCGINPNSGANRWLPNKTTAAQIKPRIVGGEVMSEGDIPWIVSIESKDDESFRCGGTIIHKQIILSADQCFTTLKRKDKGRLIIKAGVCDPDATFPGKQQVRADEYIELYRERENEFIDAALIKLDRPFEWTDYVRPACLPGSERVDDNSGHLKPGTDLTIAGWGRFKDQTNGSLVPGTVLRAAVATISDEETCGKALPIYDHSKDFCTSNPIGTTDYIGASWGDSGGPALYLRHGPTYKSKWEVEGIIIGGSLGPIKATRYTRVRLLKDWIEDFEKRHLRKNDR